MQKGVEALLREDYSLEQVVEILSKQEKPVVSIERIYQLFGITKKP